MCRPKGRTSRSTIGTELTVTFRSFGMSARVQQDVAALVELVKQPYALDPGSLEYLVEQSTQVPGGPVLVTCRSLSEGSLSSIDRENIENFVRHAAQQPTVRRALEKSVKRKGRCPKAEQAWLKRILLGGRLAGSVKPPRPISGPLQPGSEPKALLDLPDVSGSIDQFPEFLDRIGALSRNANHLNIALTSFTYASALAVVAQWILAAGLVGRYDFVNCPPHVSNYLERIQFRRALVDPKIVVSPDPMDWAVGLTRINRELPTEKVTEKIVDILTTFVNPKEDERSALYVLISEMIENVHRHANAPVDGFAVAQVYPQRLKMGITLVDAGVGVRASFETGDPSIDTSALLTDADYLRAAIRLHATSKSHGHSGYGLFLLSELLSRNRGTFLLTSGNATIVGYRRRGTLQVDQFSHRYWQGTIVSVVIDLQRDLPLLQIYNEMPLPEGFTDDELFERRSDQTGAK